ncbi:hypothetical protein BaRGS_00029606, partial [Batillaria attramentaria]
ITVPVSANCHCEGIDVSEFSGNSQVVICTMNNDHAGVFSKFSTLVLSESVKVKRSITYIHKIDATNGIMGGDSGGCLLQHRLSSSISRRLALTNEPVWTTPTLHPFDNIIVPSLGVGATRQGNLQKKI